MGYLLPFDRSVQLGQPFGSRPGMSPNPLGGHNGDDWLTVVGTPVRAAGDGVVVFAGEFDDTYADNWAWNLNYGGSMVVLNMDGDTSPYFEYGHLSVLYVKAGQRVSRGQIIALTGNSDGGTGVSTGPHCHVGCLPPNFNLGTNTYGRVNPRLYMTDYWDGSTGPISVQSVPVRTENSIEEDDMAYSEADLTRIIAAAVQPAHEVTRSFVVEKVTENTEAQHVETRKQIIGMTQAQSDVTRGYLKDRIAEAKPADLAADITAAGIAREVYDEIGKLFQAGK